MLGKQFGPVQRSSLQADWEDPFVKQLVSGCILKEACKRAHSKANVQLFTTPPIKQPLFFSVGQTSTQLSKANLLVFLFRPMLSQGPTSLTCTIAPMTVPYLGCSVAPFFLFFGGCPTKMVGSQERFPFFPGLLNNWGMILNQLATASLRFPVVDASDERHLFVDLVRAPLGSESPKSKRLNFV